MKSIKMFGLAALAALMAMAFVGASSALGETTGLCSSETEVDAQVGCNITHVHETTLSGAKAKLLTSIVNVECDVLFLGDTVGEEGAPLIIEGNFTYSNCGSCTVEEVGGGVSIEVLKLGHETADVTGEGEVHVNCSGLNCTYNGEGLLGTGKGPLLSSETNGSVVITEQVAKKVSGLFCPSTSKLDITTTPLAATYIRGALLHYCVEYQHNTNGRYTETWCLKYIGSNGPQDLVVGPPGLKVGDHICVHMNVTKTGLYEATNAPLYTKCEKDSEKLSISLYELALIILVE